MSDATQTAPQQPGAAEQPQQIPVDDRKATPLYANFCRVTGTPEELVIDFGLNPQPFGVPIEPIVFSQRIVTVCGGHGAGKFHSKRAPWRSHV